MRPAGRLASGAALWLLLAARAVAAIEPISMTIAIGAASIITGYFSYCRFAECCPKQRPLNATGRRVGVEGREGPARSGGRRAPRWGRERTGGASAGTAALEAVPPVDVRNAHTCKDSYECV